MQHTKENDMNRASRARQLGTLLAIWLLACLPLSAGGHPAEAYSFGFHNFDTSDLLPWSASPSWSLFRDTYLAIPPEPDPLKNLFEYEFYELLFKEKIGKSGNCYGISLLSVLLNKKGAHLSVCGLPSKHSGDLVGHYVDKNGPMGLPDLFLGASDGSLRYFQQETFPEEVAGNPMAGVPFASGTRPTFCDVDGDADADLFVAFADGTVRYFENTGNSKTPEFAERLNAEHPLDITGAGPITLEFADIDGDRDQDAFVAEGNGVIRYFKNEGSAIAPDFVEQFGAANPLGEVSVAGQAVLRLFDSDRDGDKDAYIGTGDGTVQYLEFTAGHFYPRTGDDNPADAVTVTGNAAPFLVYYPLAMNEPPTLQLFVGSVDGTISYYLNTGSTGNPHFTWQNPVDNPVNGITTAGHAVPVLYDIDDQDNDDVIERTGPTDPLVKYTINRLHGHQANMATIQYLSDYFLLADSKNAIVAYNDFLDNQAKGIGSVLSITRNFKGQGAHAIVPYKAETKPASSHVAWISTEVGRHTVKITGGGSSFQGHHEGTTLKIPGAGPGGGLLESSIVRVLAEDTAVLAAAATAEVASVASTWDVPERHLMYVYDCNFPYQNPELRYWYEMDANVVIIDAATGEWRYRKDDGFTIWPQSDNAHITIMPETITAPMDRTPVAMGVDALSLAGQIIVHNDGASLVQVTDERGKRMFVPGTRELDKDPETGLRSIVPMLRFDSDTETEEEVYLVWGKLPGELRFEVAGPQGYKLDIATRDQHIQLDASPIQGKDTVVMGQNGRGTRLIGSEDGTRYKLAVTKLSQPGKRADTLVLDELRLGGSIALAARKNGDGFEVDTTDGSAEYQLSAKVRTKDGVKTENLGARAQKPGTRVAWRATADRQ